jgi:hypothetical protein
LAITKNRGFWCNPRKRSAFSNWLDVMLGIPVTTLASKEYG